MGFIDRNCANDKYYPNTNGDGYTFAKVRVRNDRYPTIGDKVSCYDDITEILTDNGWINFKNLTLDMKVASLDDNKLIYQHPTKIFNYDFNGLMYKVKSNQIDLLVTGNHRMYVSTRGVRSFDIEKAEDIYGARRIYKKNVNNWIPDLSESSPELLIDNNEIIGFMIDGFDTQRKSHDELLFNINDWLGFFGIWIAEGCAYPEKVNFAANKLRVKEALTKICANMNLDISKYKYHPEDEIADSWNISNKTLANYMNKFSVGAINKYLPDWVWYLSKDQCRILIHNMCLGDGHTMKNGTIRYDTSSTKLADDFQRLCLHAGWSSNKILKDVKDTIGVIRQNGQRFVRNADAWRLTIITAQNEPLVNKNKKPGDILTYLDSWENYDGKVYCCEVPIGKGIIYVRRNGIPCWSGNSRSGRIWPRWKTQYFC
jgi:hypothetical protein